MTSDLDRLAATRRAYAGLMPRLAAGEPWDLADDYGTGPEAAWGPREVLAHVEEMLPFWLGELERVVDGSGVGAAGAPVPFGRTADDPVRIGIIARDRTLPIRVLLGRIDAGLRAWSDRLATLGDVESGRVGLHPRLGEMPASGILERFVVGHAEEHVRQLEEILAARGS